MLYIYLQVPAYANDEPDWDQDNWIPLSIPFIPSFLVITALAFALSLIIAVIFFRKQKKEQHPYTIIPEYGTNNTTNSGSNNYNSNGGGGDGERASLLPQNGSRASDVRILNI